MKLGIALSAWGLSMMPGLGIAQVERTQPLTVSYRAPAVCGEGQAFLELVRVAAPTVSLELSSTPQDQAADMVVVLRESVAGFAGSLQIRRNDGAGYFRELEAISCTELGTALAFVAALALTGQAEPSLEPTQAPPAVAPSPALPSPSGQPAQLAPRVLQPPPGSSHARWGFGVALALGIRTGVGPTWANMEQVSIELRSLARPLWAPTLRVGLLHSDSVERIDRFGNTRFTWSVGRLAACPLNIHLLETVEGVPCAGLDIGVMGAAGTPSTPNGRPGESHSLWLEGFGSFRLQVRLFRPLFVVGEGEVALPFTRPRYRFDPDVPVYAVPTVAGALFAGILAQFP